MGERSIDIGFQHGKKLTPTAADAKTTRFEKLYTGSGNAVFDWRY